MIKYSENGLWIKQEDNRYTVGISPKGQDDIGDVSFVELFNQETLTTEDSFMSVEAAKAVTEFVSPLSGKVVAWHTELEDNPEMLNQVDTAVNWIYALEEVDAEEFKALLNEDLPIICEKNHDCKEN